MEKFIKQVKKGLYAFLAVTVVMAISPTIPILAGETEPLPREGYILLGGERSWSGTIYWYFIVDNEPKIETFFVTSQMWDWDDEAEESIIVGEREVEVTRPLIPIGTTVYTFIHPNAWADWFVFTPGARIFDEEYNVNWGAAGFRISSQDPVASGSGFVEGSFVVEYVGVFSIIFACTHPQGGARNFSSFEVGEGDTPIPHRVSVYEWITPEYEWLIEDGMQTAEGFRVRPLSESELMPHSSFELVFPSDVVLETTVDAYGDKSYHLIIPVGTTVYFLATNFFWFVAGMGYYEWWCDRSNEYRESSRLALAHWGISLHYSSADSPISLSGRANHIQSPRGWFRYTFDYIDEGVLSLNWRAVDERALLDWWDRAIVVPGVPGFGEEPPGRPESLSSDYSISFTFSVTGEAMPTGTTSPVETEPPAQTQPPAPTTPQPIAQPQTPPLVTVPQPPATVQAPIAPVPTSAQTGTVTAYSLNVRAEASNDGRIIGNVSRGDVVVIVESFGTVRPWHRIQIGNLDGWVYSGFVRLN